MNDHVSTIRLQVLLIPKQDFLKEDGKKMKYDKNTETDLKSAKVNSVRPCLGKGCSNTAIHYLTVIFLKSGWFCDDCACFLKLNDLLYPFEEPIEETILDNEMSLNGKKQRNNGTWQMKSG